MYREEIGTPQSILSPKSLVLFIFAGRNRGKVTASLFPVTAVKTERSEDSPQLSDDKRTNPDLVSCAHQTDRTSSGFAGRHPEAQRKHWTWRPRALLRRFFFCFFSEGGRQCPLLGHRTRASAWHTLAHSERPFSQIILIVVQLGIRL